MSGAATDSSEQHGAARTPRATYRLQLGAALTLRDAAALVPYLDELGISDLYLFPILRARPGSEHGYDVVDHREVNPELGTLDDLRRLGLALRARGMGLILDVVPNHMSIAASHNARWNDVLENGPASASARWFDIDWRPPKRELRGKVLYPILGAPFGRVLEGGELRVAFDPVDGSFAVHYYDHRLPLAPRSLPHVLRPTLERLRAARSEDDPAVQELESILFALSCLPPRHEPDAQRRRLRQREAQVIKRRLRQLFLGGPAALATALGDALR